MTIVSTDNGRVHETVALTPSIAPDALAGLVALAYFLLGRGYGLRRRARILDYVAREGTLEGCPHLDRHHAITAESAYVGGMTEVPAIDPAWGSAPGAEFWGNPADDLWTPSDATARLDVAELLHDDAEFESWLSSIDAVGLPPVPDTAA